MSLLYCIDGPVHPFLSYVQYDIIESQYILCSENVLRFQKKKNSCYFEELRRISVWNAL